MERRGAAKWAGFAAAATALLALCVFAGRPIEIGAWPPLHLPFGARVPAGSFIAVYAATWICCIAAFVLLPRAIRFRTAAVTVLAVATLARLALLAHPASDDVNRYLWEGRLVAAGLSPYRHAPVAADDVAADRFRDPDDRIWTGINHPEMTAIYPPLALALFAATSAVAYDPLAIKVVMTLFDLGAIGVLLGLLHRRRAAPRLAILYALNPLSLHAFAAQGHIDAVIVFLLLAAVHLAADRQWRWMYVALGAAVAVKYPVLLAVPFFVRRENVRHGWIGASVAIAAFAPFVWHDGAAVFASLMRFGSDMAFNGFLHGWVRLAAGAIGPATALCALASSLVFVFGLARFVQLGQDSNWTASSAGAMFSLSAFIVFSPTIHFWYLTPLLALAALEGSALWLLASLTISFGFVANGVATDTGAFALPVWAQLASWSGPAFLLALHCRRPLWPRFPVPRSVSVVIPARNECAWIDACVRSAAADASVAEVIVSDGGSSDGTVDSARAAGARVVSDAAHAGRGGQIAAGIAAARGDVVAVVHADTRLRPGALDEAIAFLAANPRHIGGALGSSFDAQSLPLQILEVANCSRAALSGVSFGDQVQFFRRGPVVEAGIYPAIPLMEDVELSLRLTRLGRVAFLWQRNRVSARRWQRNGAARTALIFRLLLTYMLRRLFQTPETMDLYHRYYGVAVPERAESASGVGARGPVSGNA